MHRLAVVAVVWSCAGTEPPPGEPAWFPPDYAATYQETRSCRLSLEHSSRIRILTSADAVDAFARTQPFAAGAIVLKEQYAYADVTCTGPVERYTVMRKLPVGTSPDTLDWEWQGVGSNLHEEGDDISGCVSCHDTCGKAPMGYDGTCSEPL